MKPVTSMLIVFGVLVPIVCGTGLGAVFFYLLPPPSVPTTNFIIGFMSGYLVSMGIGLFSDGYYRSKRAGM